MPKPARDNRKSLDYEEVRQTLKLKGLRAKNEFSSKHKQAEEFLTSKGVNLSKIREHSSKLLGAGALTGTLLLTPPTNIGQLPPATEMLALLKQGESHLPAVLPSKLLVESLEKVLPDTPRSLSRDEEKYLERLFNETLRIETRATLEGEHLNTTYGYIGAEQHLRRYPGDTLSQHGSGDTLDEGIAPGLGAWGYFTNSKNTLTEELVETEKWYAVVQTLYLPSWGSRQPYLRDWYKYRKVLIVNTENGKAVVAAVADAGPAAWTGKQYGGSPEVMDYLGGARYKKGPVVVFFVDDPDNTVPLGPVDYNDTMVSIGKG